ncbi:unnamed protein product [Paramecium sonneborni]|uniref:Uncharacterized protein n=1 Tax=Paramecium sonneborni TaxID=65129 RepID=A0A8S1R8R0_9CILI|nr:unnamed protein product [Paramecium sonneborni]
MSENYVNIIREIYEIIKEDFNNSLAQKIIEFYIVKNSKKYDWKFI